MKIAAAIVLIGACCSLAWAKPAAWYLWRSPYADGAICSQIAPGEGWVVIRGPYQDGVCKKSGAPH